MIDFFKEMGEFFRKLDKILELDPSKAKIGDQTIVDLHSDKIGYRNPLKDIENLITFTANPLIYTVIEYYRMNRIAYNEDKKRELYNEHYAEGVQKIVSDIMQFDTIYKNIGLGASTAESISEWIKLYDESCQEVFELETFLKTGLQSLTELKTIEQKEQAARKYNIPIEKLIEEQYQNIETEYDSLIGTIEKYLPIVEEAKKLRKAETSEENQRTTEKEQREALLTPQDLGSIYTDYAESIWPAKGKRDPFESLYGDEKSSKPLNDPFLPSKGYTNKEKGFDISEDFSSYIDDIMSLYNIPGLSSGILEGSAGQAVGSGFSLFPGSVGSLDSLFGMGGGISIPLQYEIEVKGLEQFESVKEKAEEASEAVEQSRDTVSNFSSEMMRQFLKLDEEKRAAFSVDLTMLPLSIMGIGGAPFQFSMPTEESKEFSETLSDIAGIAEQLGAGFTKQQKIIYLESLSNAAHLSA